MHRDFETSLKLEQDCRLISIKTLKLHCRTHLLLRILNSKYPVMRILTFNLREPRYEVTECYFFQNTKYLRV